MMFSPVMVELVNIAPIGRTPWELPLARIDAVSHAVAARAGAAATQRTAVHLARVVEP